MLRAFTLSFGVNVIDTLHYQLIFYMIEEYKKFHQKYDPMSINYLENLNYYGMIINFLMYLNLIRLLCKREISTSYQSQYGGVNVLRLFIESQTYVAFCFALKDLSDFITFIIVLKIIILGIMVKLVDKLYTNQEWNCDNCYLRRYNQLREVEENNIYLYQGTREMYSKYQIENEKIYLNCNNNIDPISLEEFRINDKIVILPCDHYFTESSIICWFINHNTCPLCRDSNP
jgi:hypothetical protein